MNEPAIQDQYVYDPYDSDDDQESAAIGMGLLRFDAQDEKQGGWLRIRRQAHQHQKGGHRQVEKLREGGSDGSRC